jgi:hypothetical protein
MRTVKVTGIAILTVGTAAVFIAVKARLSPHEHFKRTAAAVRKVHCGCTSSQIWAEKTPQTFLKIYGVGVCEKGCCLAVTSLLSLGYSIFELTCLPSALKSVDFTGFLLVFLCQRA